MRRSAPPRHLFCLSLCFLCLTGGAAHAGHGVRIGATNSTKSALLAALAGELVRAALDVPILMPPLANSCAAWKALRNGDIDVYPESIAALAAEILHDPDAANIDRLRRQLAGFQVRMTDPVGDIVLLYRAELPALVPASMLMLLQAPRLIGPGELQDMVARSREVAPSAIAADFLRNKQQSPPARQSTASPWLWGAVLLGILAACWGVVKKNGGKREIENCGDFSGAPV